MNLLLDTHVAIWTLTDRAQVPASVIKLIEDETNEVYVSAISIMEIAIKFAIRKASAPPFDGRTALQLFLGAKFAVLPLTAVHAAAMDELRTPHGDPFDRALLAQAISEPLRLVTYDRRLAQYSDGVITWA